MFELDISAHFSAAHNLVGYHGSCANLHGHNWKVQVFIQCSQLDELGFSVDFRTVKNELASILARYDHQYLNDLQDFAGINPTSENIARNIYRQLAASIQSTDAKISKVRVCESDTAGVSYSE